MCGRVPAFAAAAVVGRENEKIKSSELIIVRGVVPERAIASGDRHAGLAIDC